MKTVSAALLALLLVLPATVRAYDGFPAQLQPEHRSVIQTMDARFEAAVAAADGAKPTPDIAAMKEAAAGAPIAFDPQKLAGKWRCRSIQAGPDGAVYAYPYFSCEIRVAEDGTLKLAKPTGSQRRLGQLWPDRADRMGYTGAMYFDYDKQIPAYGDKPDRSEAGYLYLISPKRARLHVVNGQQPDTFEILDLRRS